MAATSASIKKHLTIILLFFTTLLATSFAKSPRLVANLIHRDSIHSPYYNPNIATDIALHARAKRELKGSIARFAYLLGAQTTNENDYRAGLIPDDAHAIFMANISIGEPPVVQLLLMDTGSNILWFQCLPCTKCYQQSLPIFDPSKSSTYELVPCHVPYCFSFKCDLAENCVYSQAYLDGSSTSGNVAYETLTFKTSDEGISNISKIVVGCGHKNVETNAQHSGILGLGPLQSRSLVFSLGSKFSYCIGDIRDPHYAFNNLILGDGAKIEGNSSPLEFYNGRYYVSLEGISVGSKRLEIDPNIFQISLDTGDGGVIIDSGSTLSFLVEGAYEPLSNEVHKALTGGGFERVQDASNGSSPLCYTGNINRINKGFPPVTFYFAKGAKLVLGVNSMFYENDPNQFCMSVIKNPLDNDLSLIGVLAQQYYNVAYNLEDKTISFLKVDCQLL